MIGYLAAATSVVHTTGVNWQSVLTITGSIVTLLTILGALVGRYIANRITAAIATFQNAVVSKLDTRLTIVETKLDTLNRNNPRYPDDPAEPSRRGSNGPDED